MAIYNRYIKLRKAIRYPDGTIEYIVPFEEKKGELISQENFESLEDCLYNYQYRWYTMPLNNEDSNTFICEGYAQYYKEVYQKSTDNEHWVDVEPKQERKGDLVKEFSEACGYVPLTEWRVVEFDKSNPDSYICEFFSLYKKEVEYISYDNGKTYEPSGNVRKGDLIEHYSETCGYVPLIEWRLVDLDLSNTDTFICDGYDLYRKEVEYISYDNGATYEPTGRIRKGDLYEENSDYCKVFAKGQIVADKGEFYVEFNMENEYFYTDVVTSFNFSEWWPDTDKKLYNINIKPSSGSTDTVLRFIDFHPYLTDAEFFQTVNFSGNISSFVDCDKFITTDIFDFSTMFMGCKILTSLELSSFDTSNAKSMWAMFGECEKLTNINLKGWNTSNVNNMMAMFRECRSLPSLDISHFNTAQVTNMGNMFMYCEKLTSLELSNFNFSSLEDCHGMFYGCTSLSDLKLNHTSGAYVQDGNSMFEGCSSLTSLDLRGFAFVDMAKMFYGCSKLERLDLSNFEITNSTYISQIFGGCNNLKYIKCTEKFKNWCISKQNTIKLPSSINWEIVG